MILYGVAGETHETAFISTGNDTCVTISGSINHCQSKSGTVVVNYETSGLSVVDIGSEILLYILGKLFRFLPDSITKLTKFQIEIRPILSGILKYLATTQFSSKGHT